MFDINKLKVPFVDIPPSSLESRKTLLRRLRDFITENEDDICKAIESDLHKPRQECLVSEILPIKAEITNQIANMDTWAGPKSIARTFLTMFDSVSTEPQPLGRVLILGTWNYPLFLLFCPMVGALAAGNAIVLKPSEMAPETESLFANLLPRYLDETVVQIFTGGAEQTMKLLDEHRFDHVFYTGGMNAARSILSQVAKYLTPVTLELGGKSPVYVDPSVDMGVCAKRLIWAKGLNCGQTCVAPDYVLCHKSVEDKFIAACCEMAKTFYGENMKESPDYGRIINKKHAARLVALLQNTKGTKVFGGRTEFEKKFVELTIVKDIKEDDPLMQEEIFGPILPIMRVNSSDEAITFVNKREKPLTMYVYASDKSVMSEWKKRTTSGSIVFNDCILQLAVSNLPFGGVGNSGTGRYFGEETVKTFSNERSVLDKSTMEKANNLIRYPPYDASKEKWARWGLAKNETSCSIM